jgi:anthranilate phosphoribosyltransferase
MIVEAIGKMVAKQDLESDEMAEVMKELTLKHASTAQIASFITALRMKGETPGEITSAARVIKDKAPRIHAGQNVVSLDREEITVESETIRSTSQDSAGRTAVFNISTATALVTAGGGVSVAKHGRRSTPPLCGCAEVTEALGINLDLTSTQLERCAKEVEICFIYEPLVQNGLDHIMSVRKKMGIRTIFNLLDPLINPAGARFQVLGVYDSGLTEIMAMVLKDLGIERAMVVHGEDTLDEMSITGTTKVTELRDGAITTSLIEPEDFGMKKWTVAEIRGGGREENAAIILDILKGDQGAKRDVVVLNAAAAFVVSGRARDLAQGAEMAGESIDSGEALKTLNRVIDFTTKQRPFVREI